MAEAPVVLWHDKREWRYFPLPASYKLTPATFSCDVFKYPEATTTTTQEAPAEKK